MKARFLKAKLVDQLRSDIGKNLERYRSGDFSGIVDMPEAFFEGEVDIDEHGISQITACDGLKNEAHCCELMLASAPSIGRYVAHDERFWVYLTHTLMLEYSRTRWPIPLDDSKAIRHIEVHFFARGSRGIERNNAASRLWWMGFLCSRTSGLTIQEALECFLYQTDVRANIVERPTTAQNEAVFVAVLQQLHISFNGDRSLFIRKRFREFMKRLNLLGGVKLLAALPADHVCELVEECAFNVRTS